MVASGLGTFDNGVFQQCSCIRPYGFCRLPFFEASCVGGVACPAAINANWSWSNNDGFVSFDDGTCKGS